MAYKIEDIDWDKMPEGAVEFALEDDNHHFTWYDDNNRFKIDIHPEWLEDDEFGDPVKYKVSDYHPSTTITITRKPTREERLGTALRTLIQRHFHGVELASCWRDGTTLASIDPTLYKEIVDLLN